jgi:hypothetical protein
MMKHEFTVLTGVRVTDKECDEFVILSSRLFGEFSRYKLDKCRTRFGDIVYMVMDAETPDPITGLPQIIRQAATEEEAIKGLV